MIPDRQAQLGEGAPALAGSWPDYQRAGRRIGGGGPASIPLSRPYKETDPMRQHFGSCCAALALALAASAARADDYAVDPVHTSVTFKVEHLGLAWIHGRFNG